MSIDSQDGQDPTLPPPGHRWGAGAQSVLPYLTRSLQARPTSASEETRDARARADGVTKLEDRPSRAA